MRQYAPLLGLLLILCAACGGAPPPQDQLTAVQAAIRAAEVAGAPGVPKAALHLKKASEQLATGKGLVQKEENEKASVVLHKAEADADLALALAQEETARKEMAAAEEKVQKMRKKVK